MGFKRSNYDKIKNQKLAQKTPSVCGFSGGSYFDTVKNRYIRVYRSWDRHELSKRTNKRLRRTNEALQNGAYKLICDSYYYC